MMFQQTNAWGRSSLISKDNEEIDASSNIWIGGVIFLCLLSNFVFSKNNFPARQERRWKKHILYKAQAAAVFTIQIFPITDGSQIYV